MATVVFKNIQKRYDDVLAVQDLSLDIADGEFMVLVGPSGSGKTTALRMLAGLEAISGGTIDIGGKVVNDIAPRERDVAMVFQDYALYPQMTVFDNLAFGLRRRKTDKAAIEKRVAEAGEALDITKYMQRKPGQLSGGQAQRVALGRALVRDPQVFLMDEPLSNLDAKLRTQTRGEIKKLQKDFNTTTVYVTHDQVEAMTLGDRIAIMQDGLLEQVGTPEELYERPANKFVASFIGSPSMTFFDATTTSQNGSVHLKAPQIDVDVPNENGPQLPNEVTVGVRPECARAWVPGANLLGPITGEVEYVEALGRETFVGVDVGGSKLTVHHEGRAPLHPGENLAFGLQSKGLRYFDTETGKLIAAAGEASKSA